MTLKDLMQLLDGMPENSEILIEQDDDIYGPFTVKADVATEIRHYLIDGAIVKAGKIIFFEEDSEEDGGGQ